MQATPPTMPSQALQLMASKGYSHIYNGAWVFATPDDRNAWHSTPWNFLPRVGLNYRIGEDAVARVAYARYMMPISNVRDTLGDFVNQYTGFAQTTTTLGLAAGIPQQTLRDPFPANNPVIEPYGQAYGRYTGPRRRRESRRIPAAPANQRSVQSLVPEGNLGQHRSSTSATSTTGARASRTTST